MWPSPGTSGGWKEAEDMQLLAGPWLGSQMVQKGETPGTPSHWNRALCWDRGLPL